MRKVIEHCKISTVHVSVMYVCFRFINKVLHLYIKKNTVHTNLLAPCSSCLSFFSEVPHMVLALLTKKCNTRYQDFCTTKTGKWFEPRSLRLWCGLIVWGREVSRSRGFTCSFERNCVLHQIWLYYSIVCFY